MFASVDRNPVGPNCVEPFIQLGRDDSEPCALDAVAREVPDASDHAPSLPQPRLHALPWLSTFMSGSQRGAALRLVSDIPVLTREFRPRGA